VTELDLLLQGSRVSAEDQAKLRRTVAIIGGEGTYAEAREAAGLSVGQAAGVTTIDRARLRAIESGDATPTDDELARLRETYDVAGFVGAGR